MTEKEKWTKALYEASSLNGKRYAARKLKVNPETEKIVLGSQIFVLVKLRDDLLSTLGIKKLDSADSNIENYSLKVGNVLFVLNSTINRLSEQYEGLQSNKLKEESDK